ncbi:MAG: GumC family protein [Planctomycetota bacterium]
MSNQTKGPFQLFYEYLYVIVIVTAVAVISAYLITNSMTPQYRSQARCYMPNDTSTMSLNEEAGNIPNSPLLPTANPDFQASLMGVLAAQDTRLLVASKIEGVDSEYLKKNVEFQVDRFNLITITAYDPDAKMAYQIAQTYLDTFQNKLNQATTAQAEERRTTFSNGIARAQGELTELEADRLAFMKEHGAIDFISELSLLTTRQSEYENKLNDITTNLASAREQRTEMVKQFEARPETEQASSTMVKNPQLEELNRNLSTVKRERVTLGLQFKDNHPTIQAKDLEIAALEGEIKTLEATIQGSATIAPDTMRKDLEGRLNDLDLRVAAMTTEAELHADSLATTKTRRIELSGLQAQLEAKDSQIKNLRGTLVNYRDRYAELNIYIERQANFLQIPEYPSESSSPYLPILWVNLLVAAVLGLSLAICVVLVLNQVRFSQEEALW